VRINPGILCIVLSALLNKIGLGWFNRLLGVFLALGVALLLSPFWFSRFNANSARYALA
jgi:uncharacterized membrane protein required for colicin V production